MSTPEWLGGTLPPIPANEEERLVALSRFERFVDDPEQKIYYDRLAILVAHFCEVPVSFINLIGEDRQINKSCYGYSGEMTSREDSFCQYTIIQDDIFEVKDSHEDKFFKNNPNVHNELNVRYYAGIPLKTPSGYNIGTLCLVDHKPNSLTDLQREALTTLSLQIVARMELSYVKHELEKNNAEKDELIRIVSHDMRNPLAGILGFSELLKLEITDEEHREMLSSIENAGESMLDIVNVLLNSEYIRNQAFILDLKQVDVAEITKEVIYLHKPLMRIKQLNLDLQLDEPMVCNMDEEKWKQIVGNLLSNAIKFTPEGGTVKLYVKKLETERPMIELTVADSGIGIPEDKLKDLFTGKDSVRREGTSGEVSTGLGMFIIKKYLSLLKGMIDVKSEIGKGTHFKIKFPV